MHEIPGGTAPPAVAGALAAWKAVLDGDGPPLAVSPPRATHAGGTGAGGTAEGLAPGQGRVPPGTAVVLSTSGSTGTPRHVALCADALLASADAAHARLGGPGRWLLALGIHHVAGWQVLVRSVRGGTEPLVLDTSAGFDPAALAAAVTQAGSTGRTYASLVPTQLVRVLSHPAARTALATFDAVLVGGAALPAGLRARAEGEGIRVVATYGMTETGGGCVYDGVPLDGVRVRVDDGRLAVAGPTLALGYVAGDDAVETGAGPGTHFVVRDDVRWVVTADAGALDPDGRVRVLGRLDDVIVTGGVKVHPVGVERVLADHPAVGEAVVVGLPDPEWGSVVTAVVVPRRGSALDLVELRRLVGSRLGAPYAPRRLAVVESLPRLGAGKVDRARAARLAAAILAGP